MRLLPAILALAFLPACGGAQLILHDPIEDKCKSSGLRGCEDLADGIVLYVDGQKPLGYDKVKQGVSVNMDDPDKVKAFVMGVRLLQKVPGIGPYLAQMRPLIDMMDASADEAIKKGASRNARNQPAVKAPRAWTPDDDDDDPPAKKPKAAASATPSGPVSGDPLRAATIIVAGHKKAKACAALAQTPAGAQGDAQCVVMFVGPIVVTDVHVGLGCPNEMIVLAGDTQGPRWYVVAPSGLGVGVHGASFTVPADEELVVVARMGSAKAMRSDAACGVTWAGRKL